MKHLSNQHQWKPNSVPIFERAASVLLAFILLLYGSSGLLRGGFAVSFIKARTGLVISGRPAWLLAAASFVGALILLSVVLDHYDKRNNEDRYRIFRRVCLSFGSALFVAALVSGFYVGLVG